ncbi:hypothetical protein Tco_0628668 [Tanacetum coccineum]|uniref:Uncharacterized protein n=1 Tax=Tanacetum coccineum TaxID=301880 RepID=A0ABQ4WRQ8_9ASTR
MSPLIRKKFRWGTIFPIGLKRYRDPKEEPIEKEPLMELKGIGYSSLISLNRGSFDVIVVIDWLSKRKFVIVCHEKVVEIPLEGRRKLYAKFTKIEAVKYWNYHSSIWCAPFEALYGMKCRSHVLWAEIGESSLIGPELVQEMTDKVVLIKASRDRQKRLCLNNRDRKLRVLGRRRFIGIKADPEFTWERKDHMKSKYPQLFVDRAVESAMLNAPWPCFIRAVIVNAPWLYVQLGGVLREDHGTSGDAGASTARKSLVALQGLLNHVEVTSIVKSPILPPLVITAPVATTAVAGTSYVPGAGIGRLSRAFLRILLLQMNSETLQQIYIPKWNVINDFSCDDPEFNVRAACQTCLSAEVKLRSEHNLRERKKFKRKCARQIDLLKEKDTEIASLKAQLSLKEAEATEAIHLRSQVSVVEAAEAARVNKLNSLKEWNLALEVAKLNHDLSSLKLSCDELSIKATSLESQKDNLTDQDEQVKILSDHVAKLDSKLMSMAVHLDEEFYPRFLTTIEYAAALGTAIGLAIEKGMQNGLVASIDHERAA